MHIPRYQDTMATSEDTQDAIKGSEDMQFSMVEPEDIPDRGEEKKNKKLHKITTSGLSFQFSPVVISLPLYGIKLVCCFYHKPEHTVLTLLYCLVVKQEHYIIL